MPVSKKRKNIRTNVQYAPEPKTIKLETGDVVDNPKYGQMRKIVHKPIAPFSTIPIIENPQVFDGGIPAIRDWANNQKIVKNFKKSLIEYCHN